MNLDEIKRRRLTEGKADAKKATVKKVRTLPSGAQVYANESDTTSTVDVEYTVDKDGKHTFVKIVSEAEKPKTPKFVQHCVAAITSDPERLAKVQARKDGSPFGICVAQHKKNKPELNAAHSQGKHHTVKDYKKALEKLRESVDGHASQNIRPDAVVFNPNVITESDDPLLDTSAVRYTP
jgi:hypothetical protein